MGRNKSRIETFRATLTKHNNPSEEELDKSLELLNKALELTLNEVRAQDVLNVYGYPAIKTESQLILVVLMVNHKPFSTLGQDGRYKYVEPKEMLDYLLFKARWLGLTAGVIQYAINDIESDYKGNKLMFNGKTYSISRRRITLADA